MRAEVAPGVALHVVAWDGGDGVPFLLVHGLASNARTWERVAEALGRLGHPAAAVDQRGHGRSDKPDAGYDFATLCDDLLAVVDILGWDRPVVAGQSTGGNVAVELAHRVPERVAGIAGVDGGAIELGRQFSEWDDCARALAPPRLAGSPAATVEARLRAAHPTWSDWGIEATMANFERLPDGTIRPWLSFERHLMILRSLWEHRPSTILPSLKVPALLVMADSGDDWSARKRADAAQLAVTAPDVRVAWFSPADHDVHVEFPTELAVLLHESF